MTGFLGSFNKIEIKSTRMDDPPFSQIKTGTLINR